jgi:hypothetical protein
MTSIAAAAAPLRGTGRYVGSPRVRRGAISASVTLCILLSGILFVFLSSDQRLVWAPLLVMTNLVIAAVAVLYRRDRELPLFEIGTVYLLVILIYSAVPLINFVSAGLSWQIDSDPRLNNYATTAADVGAFAWRHVLYIASFAISYLVVRGRAHPPRMTKPQYDKPTVLVVVVLFSCLLLYQFALGWYVGPTGSGYAGETVPELADRVPYFVAQITHVFATMALTLKQCFAILLLTHWKSWKWRLTLILWIAFEIVVGVIALGARSPTAMVLLTIGLLYHRMVKPFPLWKALAGMTLFLGALLLYGVLRDQRGLSLSSRQQGVATVAHNNEFQVLWANGYDLHVKKEEGSLEVPWQVYVSEFTLVIPSQILPFRKMDPSLWYLETLGMAGSNVGLMFGVIAQCVIGFDWPEIAIRGALLGILFAMLHRFYARRSRSFWATALYVFMCVWSYYTFRATSFWIGYFVLYQFLPVWVLVVICRILMKRVPGVLVRAAGMAPS